MLGTNHVEARWAAANELIRAGDDLRLLASVGRAHHSDTDRWREADEQWTAWQHLTATRAAGGQVVETVASL